MAEWASLIEAHGFAVVPRLLSEDEAGRLAAAVENRKGGFSDRDLARKVPEVQALLYSSIIRRLVEEVLGHGAFPVRCLLFDKTPQANWKVPWHQDRTIAVRMRREVDGFGPWSVKEGVPHVQPPAALLERMLALRLHLDPCGEENGPLRVLPGSHRDGRMSPVEIRAWQGHAAPVRCCTGAGGAVLMRPLLLHASSVALRPEHRRVVHIEWATESLPAGLEWQGFPL